MLIGRNAAVGTVFIASASELIARGVHFSHGGCHPEADYSLPQKDDAHPAIGGIK